MKEFMFTLKFLLPVPTQDPEEYIDRLGEAGCDDAVIGMAQKGRIALQFSREGENALSAIESAIKDVKSVIPNAELIESMPDLVGISDIAKLIGVSRQYLHKLELTRHNFPQPLHSGNISIWHLYSFLQWYEESLHKRVNKSIKDIAYANMHINIAKEWLKLDKNTQSKISSIPL